MSTPYVGEIRMFGFGRIPSGWFACDGSQQPISQYEALYTLLGTTYGGNGTTTFCVPDLRGAAPIHQGKGAGLSNYVIGQKAGTESITLLSSQLPNHSHAFLASQGAASTPNPGAGVLLGNVAGNNPADTWYYPANANPMPTAVTMAPAAISQDGNGLPHDNCMPSLTVSFCIAWAGVFPSQN
ncbi:MAG: phage tail protein [Proteobacteria bacterium]|nr:phage tail protein [Pseudomonadota bacterium]